MRSLFVLFLYMANMLFVDAQHIRTDRIEKDGRHQIMTSAKSISFGRDKFRFSMKIYETANKIDWCLVVSSFCHIPRNAELLLRLGNEKVLHLSCTNVKTGIVTQQENIRVNISTNVIVYNNNKFYSSLYEIDEELIDSISVYGIKKIRISLGRSYKDKEFAKNQLGKFLVKSRKKIQKRLDNPLDERDIKYVGKEYY